MKFLSSFFLLAFLQTCGLQAVDHNSDLEQRINMVLQQADCGNKIGTWLNFSDLSEFEWDRLFVIGAYQSTSDLQLKAGIDLNEIKDQSIRYGKLNQHVLIFTLDKKVVSYVKYPRTGNFDGIIETKRGYSPQEAIFMVCERGDSTIQGIPIFQITKDSVALKEATADNSLGNIK